MNIIFYNMEGCGYCMKAKQLLKKEIDNKEIIVRPSSEAPADTEGFPTFVAANGKMYSGLPSSKEELYSNLGFKEKYQDNQILFWGVR